MRVTTSLVSCLLGPWLAGCGPATLDPIATEASGSTGGTGGTGETGGVSGMSSPTEVMPATDGSGTDPTESSGGESSGGGTTEVDLLTCAVEGTCNQLDLLLVIDNSGSMAEEQLNLAKQFPKLVERLRTLDDAQGQAVGVDVNVMVTTTDVGNPLCSDFYNEGYLPAMGGPITTPCTDRLSGFTAYGGTPSVPEACTSVCNTAAAPSDPFIHFDLDGDNIMNASGMGDPAVEALACIAPQGIDGCGMESPLEAMIQALSPDASWNTGEKPFLRPGGVLAIVILTDETDCSTLNFDYFDPSKKDDPEFNQYWPDQPYNPGIKQDPTSGVCWNSSMTCTEITMDDVYESCVAEDKGVLHPRARYTDILAQAFEAAGKPVFMLLLSGVPSVTAHDPEAPHGPTAGGILDLVHREWRPSDILPGDPKDAATKQYEFAIGPGCSNADTGQAVPPGRIQDICEALDQPGELRCCIESICDESFAGAMDCLADMLAQKLTAD